MAGRSARFQTVETPLPPPSKKLSRSTRFEAVEAPPPQPSKRPQRGTTRFEAVEVPSNSELEPSGTPSDDPEYHNSPQRRSHAYAGGPTPQKNTLKGSSVGYSTKAALEKVAPYGNRCLLTLENLSGIQVCRLISVKQTKPSTLLRLEHFWGVQPRSLNFHTKQNLVFLKSDKHFSFDKGDWALIPTESVLKEIYDEVIKSGRKKQKPNIFKKFPDKIWEYRFQPLSIYPNESIHRRVHPDGSVVGDVDHDNGVDVDEKADEAEETDVTPTIFDASLIPPVYQTFAPPFSDFPILRSQVHPVYAIFNAGQKLVRDQDMPEEYRHDLLVRMYHRWMSGIIPGLEVDPEDPPSPSPQGGSSGPSNHPTTRSTKRRRETDGDKGGPNLKKSRGGSNKRGKTRRQRHSWGSKTIQGGQSSDPQKDSDAGQEGVDPSSPPLPFWETIPGWVEQSRKAISNGRITTTLDNKSRDIKDYQREPARKPFPEGYWTDWNVEWAYARTFVDPGVYGRKWTSNDWACFWTMTLLPRSPYN